MRRSEREVADLGEIEGIIKGCRVCRIAVCDGGAPYVTPVNFGYTLSGDGGLALYFHGAREGRRADILRANPMVCFEMDIELGYVHGEQACGSTAGYASLIGFGEAAELEGEAKRRGLDTLMKQVFGQTPQGGYTYGEAAMARTAVYKISAKSYTAKRSQILG